MVGNQASVQAAIFNKRHLRAKITRDETPADSNEVSYISFSDDSRHDSKQGSKDNSRHDSKHGSKDDSKYGSKDDSEHDYSENSSHDHGTTWNWNKGMVLWSFQLSENATPYCDFKISGSRSQISPNF